MPRQKSGEFDQKEYSKEYQRQFIKFRKMNFNIQNRDDSAMVDWIDSQPEGTSGYLKRLVKADMESRLTENS